MIYPFVYKLSAITIVSWGLIFKNDEAIFNKVAVLSPTGGVFVLCSVIISFTFISLTFFKLLIISFTSDFFWNFLS